MAKYDVDIYYSGFITVPVDAGSEEDAIETAREEAARLHNKREGKFLDEFLPTLEVWREADTARIIE